MKKLLETVCGIISGTALFAIMALTFFDVGGRKLASNSIPGSFELTELLMVVVIFGAIPLVSLRGEHVVFDSFDRFLPTVVKRVHGIAINLMLGIALLALGYLMFKTGQQFAINGDTTAQLQIPKAPFLYGIGLLCGVTGLVHLSYILKPLSASHDNDAQHSGVAL